MESPCLNISGTVSPGADYVVVTGMGMPQSQATLYADGTWSTYGTALADGLNTFTAVAEDSYGRKDTNSVSVYLPQVATFQYDLNGNLLTDGRRVFEYDVENQLVLVTISNATQSGFRYDGKMRRRERTEAVWSGGAWVTNLWVRYVYDGNLVLQERHFNPQLSTNSPQRVISYTRGLDLSGSLEGAGGIGGMLARSDHSALNAQPVSAYYHADGNGNITCMLDEQNHAVARYIYDPFGNIASSQGSLAEDNLYRFSSKEFHPQSGLVYYLYRYYDFSLQKWLNRDPLEENGGINLYRFLSNDPVMRVDPTGDNPRVVFLLWLLIWSYLEENFTVPEEAPLVFGAEGECPPPFPPIPDYRPPAWLKPIPGLDPPGVSDPEFPTPPGPGDPGVRTRTPHDEEPPLAVPQPPDRSCNRQPPRCIMPPQPPRTPPRQTWPFRGGPGRGGRAEIPSGVGFGAFNYPEALARADLAQVA